MATSLYGTVKKIGSSQFTFDKIYTSRKAMEMAMTTDGIYHGRYVLVSYGNEQLTNSTNGGTITLTNNTNTTEHYSVSYNSTWLQNYNLDLQNYNNIYDKTVWQKIFDGTTAKYIMVASLNARAPGLTINEDYYSFELRDAQNNEIGEEYYIKGQTNPITKVAKYPIPKWKETLSNDLIYHLDMPMPVHLNLNNFEYFQTGLNPLIHTEFTPADDNHIRWEYTLTDNNKVTDADFSFTLPALGEAISNIYDALYGVPMTTELDENDEPVQVPSTGRRPFVTSNNETSTELQEDMLEVLGQTDYKGLFYILSHVGLDANGHYLLRSNWAATENDFGYIEHKPALITNIAVNNNSEAWTFTVNDN